jgi:hypothetical protein
VLQEALKRLEYEQMDMMVDNLRAEEENDVGGSQQHVDDYKKKVEQYSCVEPDELVWLHLNDCCVLQMLYY